MTSAAMITDQEGVSGGTPHSVPAEEGGDRQAEREMRKNHLGTQGGTVCQEEGTGSVKAQRQEWRLDWLKEKKGCVAGEELLKGRQRTQGGVWTCALRHPGGVLSTQRLGSD